MGKPADDDHPCEAEVTPFMATITSQRFLGLTAEYWSGIARAIAPVAVGARTP